MASFSDAIGLLKTTYASRIFDSYGYHTGKMYTALEPENHNNGDANKSMSLYDNGGGKTYLKDFAGNAKTYSSIDTIMLREGISFADAVKRGAEICGITIDSDNARQQEGLCPGMKYIISGLYRKAKQENFSIKSITGKYHYLYRDATGKKLFDKYRIDFVDAEGKKHKHIVQGKENNGFIKFKFENGEYQNLIAMYGSFRQYEPGEKVYIVEGENCVDSCHSSGMKNVVTVGSSNDFKYKGKRFAPFFKGTDIIILQDNDKPGEKLTREIISALEEVANSIKVIVPDRSREKADIADFFQNGGTLQQLEKMERNTVPVQKQATGENTPNLDIGQEIEPDKMQFHLTDKNGVPVGVFDAAIENHIVNNQKLFIYGGIPFLYSNGCFFPDWTRAELSTSIRKKIYERLIKSTTIDRVYRLFLTDARIQKSFDEINAYPAEWICFRNGMYDPINKKIMPHDEKYYCINQVPHEYHPEMLPKAGEAIEEYLNFICDGKQDTREMLLQFMGYSLTRDTRQQKFLILTGEGGSGKSTLIKCFEMLAGQRNISNVSLTDLQQRFSSIELMGMLVNSCADLEIGALTDTSMIKKLVGEDSIKGERKGKDLVFFKNYAKLIFSTNELPVVKAEKTNAFYRRLIIFPMNKVPERKDPDLFQKLETEKDYLLMLAVQALERMYQQKNITVAAASEHEIERLRADSDTVEGFILEECEKVDGCREERAEIYNRYSAYCEQSERQALTKNNFYKSLRLKGYLEITSSGKRYFLGLKSALENCTNDGFIQVTQEQLEDIPFE